jgi:hypothetical protein
MLDFVGYTTGLPTAPPVTAGIRPLDFVGYPTGKPPADAVTAGFKGMLDFMGYAVGKGEDVTPPTITGGGGFDRNFPGPKKKRPKKRDEDDEIWLLI